MEFKKKTIIWEDNNEPPKDYIWVKTDGKAYEYSNVVKNWVESSFIQADDSKQKLQVLEEYLNTTIEDYFGITLDPDLDEKYYKYFTIEATQDGTTVYFRQSNYALDDPLKVEVSTDNGTSWTEVTASLEEDDVPGATIAVLNNGDKVFIRGKNEAYGF